jgi:ABC-type amino acid transport system permease subunit
LSGEDFRAAFPQVLRGLWLNIRQRAAARSLGLTHAQELRDVVLPQAVRRVIPPLLNDFVSLQKDTALVAVIGPLEALRQAQIYASGTFNYTAYLAAALLFVLLTVPMACLTAASPPAPRANAARESVQHRGRW